MHDTQTATVVGNEPIHTERDNRIKLQFLWQRSCSASHRLSHLVWRRQRAGLVPRRRKRGRRPRGTSTARALGHKCQQLSSSGANQLVLTTTATELGNWVFQTFLRLAQMSFLLHQRRCSKPCHQTQARERDFLRKIMIERAVLRQFKILLLVTLALLANCAQSETDKFYWLKYEATARVGGPEENYIVDSPDRGADAVVIQIKSNRVFLNGNLCSAPIEEVENFSINRFMAMDIDDLGGQKKFNEFISKKLKSNLSNWKKQIYTGKADNLVGAGCRLISNSALIQGTGEIIIKYGKAYYRFIEGRSQI